MKPYLDIHTHDLREYPGVISLYSCRLGIDPLPSTRRPYWCGVHPWDVDRADDSLVDSLAGIPAAGIGEIGLDFMPGRPDRMLQLQWFERQLQIASSRGLPVALHLVRAHSEGTVLLKKYRDVLPAVVIHGFTGSRQLASQYLSMGCMLSFSERALHSQKTQEAFLTTDLSSVFLESDDRPVDMERLYGRFAVLRGVQPGVLREQLYWNYCKIFSEWNG